jgi:molecular chaperone GrpE
MQAPHTITPECGPQLVNHMSNEQPSLEETQTPAIDTEGAFTQTGEAMPTIESLQAQLSDLSDAFLRAKAEAENARRRAEEEVSKSRKFAVEGFADSLLPVKDSLEAAMNLPSASNEQLLEGVQATLSQLTQALERHKVVEINPASAARFDPHQHQAISVVPAEQEAGTVVAVLQKGYLIADRVLRPALVTVSAPK